jgi:CPA2 family monovalent cation:H+ antiporter-2
MPHLPSLIYDLALILISAGFMTLLFKWLKQPLVLGYIVAGMLAGPYIDILPISVKDTHNIQTWADIGVIFLLFALGMEFSLKKLFQVGKTAFITAFVVVTGMMITGYLVGSLLKWTTMDCLFLGGMLSMSSTAIIIKSFNDLGVSKEAFTKLVFGVLVVEDLVAVILMVLLSTISVSKEFDGAQLLFVISRLLFFLSLWFIFGIFLIPTLLKKTRNLMNEETLLIISVGLCLVMVVLAVGAGFSAALGAFIMGSILAETNDVKRIEKLMEPLKIVFGAIFFVSVGMLVQPVVIMQYIWPILILICVVILGQLIFSTTGFLLSGQPLKVAVKSGFSLGQTGEFAFIIANLGLSLKVIDPFLYPVIIAVSVFTIFTTPFVMKFSDPFYRFLNNILPDNIKYKLNQPRGDKDLSTSKKAWSVLIKDLFGSMFVIATVVIAILFISVNYLLPFLSSKLPLWLASSLSYLVTIVVLSPFLKALMSNNVNSATVLNLWMEKTKNRNILIVLMGIRVFVVFLALLIITNRFFDIPLFINILLAFILLFGIFKSKSLLRRFWKLESRFLINLNERQMEENLKKIESNKGVMFLSDMAANHWLDYKIFTCALRLRKGSSFVGKRIRDLNLRDEYSINVIRIRTKSNDFINIPKGDYELKEGDTLRVAGKRSAIRKLQEDESINLEFVDHSFITLHGFSKIEYNKKEEHERLTCSGIPLSDKSPLTGKNLIESNISARTKCLVIGLEKQNRQIVNPEATTTLEAGDVVWLIGEEKPVSKHIEQNVYFLS